MRSAVLTRIFSPTPTTPNWVCAGGSRDGPACTLRGAVVRHHRGATLGLGSARRLTLIERNRVLLVVKLFPWNLIWVNGAYYLARIAAGMWAALRNRGELRRYPGAQGKLSAAMALIRGTLSALPMIPVDAAQAPGVPPETPPDSRGRSAGSC